MHQAHTGSRGDPMLLDHLDSGEAEFFELRDTYLSGMDKA